MARKTYRESSQAIIVIIVLKILSNSNICPPRNKATCGLISDVSPLAPTLIEAVPRLPVVNADLIFQATVMKVQVHWLPPFLIPAVLADSDDARTLPANVLFPGFDLLFHLTPLSISWFFNLVCEFHKSVRQDPGLGRCDNPLCLVPVGHPVFESQRYVQHTAVCCNVVVVVQLAMQDFLFTHLLSFRTDGTHRRLFRGC